MDHYATMKAIENSPKGRLTYDTGWDEIPNSINTLVTAVQEIEVDKPKREIVENAFRVIHMKERFSLSPKTSPTQIVTNRNTHSRHSLPGKPADMTRKQGYQSPPASMSKSLLSSLINLKTAKRSSLSPRTHNSLYPQPEFRIEEVSNTSWSADSSSIYTSDNSFIAGDKQRLIPPGIRRKKSVGGSPRFKPSPYSSSTHTQTHSSTTSASEVTNTTPTKQSSSSGKTKKLGIQDEALSTTEDKLEEDLYIESKASPFNYIEECNARFQDDLERKSKEATLKRLQEFRAHEKESSEKADAVLAAEVAKRKEEEAQFKRAQTESLVRSLQELELRQRDRLKEEEKLKIERKATHDTLERNRQAVEEASRQELLKIQQAQQVELKRKQEAEQLEQQRLLEQKAEAERIKAERDALEAKQKIDEARKTQQVVPELSGLILREDLEKFAKSADLLNQYDVLVANIDGKDTATKAFYVGAVKCINTPLNALADTHEGEIMAKFQHFSKLIIGEQVSGGGSMQSVFSCKSVPNGDRFVMKTLAFRFVKKSEADVTRGQSTVQPLATVGVHLCKQFPAWATLVQAYFYKLCPFLVPFSFPQGNKSIQEYARDLGHDLSGTETAIQQTFLERLKGYCTLYSLMVLKFHKEGSFEIEGTTDFFTVGGAWQILARTIKLEPQVDVTATVIHTLLDILDDTLYAVYRAQFVKLIRLLITSYVPKIKAITPATKSGSLSRLEIYLTKK